MASAASFAQKCDLLEDSNFAGKLTQESMDRTAQCKEVCVWCFKAKDAHREHFLCQICYIKKDKNCEVQTECTNNYACSCCKQCMENNLVTQFDRNSEMKTFRCICQSGQIPEAVVQRNLNERQKERLSRIRLSRKIDMNPLLIWCPNINC